MVRVKAIPRRRQASRRYQDLPRVDKIISEMQSGARRCRSLTRFSRPTFQKLVKCMVQDLGPEIRIQSNALLMLQEVTEAYVHSVRTNHEQDTLLNYL